MRVRLATDADKKDWDEYVEHRPLVPALNRYAWKGLLEDSYGVQTFFYLAEEDGSIRGVLPTYAIRDLLGEDRIHTPKFALVADSADVADELLSHLSAFCEENSMVSSLVHAGYTTQATASPDRVATNLVMELARDEETQWWSLIGSPRKRIRKAIRSKVVAGRGFDYLGDFYKIYSGVMLSKGLAPHSVRFFESISKNLADESELIVAKLNGKVIGGFLALFSADIAICPFEFSLPEYYEYAPNQFLIWEAMKDCFQRKIPTLDMGESAEDTAVYTFKARFGFKPRNVYYYGGAEERPTGARGNGASAARRKLAALPGLLTAKTVSTNTPRWLRSQLGVRLKARGRIL